MKAPKISGSTLTDTVKKLSFLKNNMGLLIPIIIVIVAALLFIPTRILQGKLQGTIEEKSLRAGNSINGLIRDVGDAAEAAAREGYMNAYAEDANQIEQMIRQTTLRELLNYEVFADTNETSILLFERFGQRYVSGIEAMLETLKSGTPPTGTEIDMALESAPRPGLAGRSSRTGRTGMSGLGMGGRNRQRSLGMLFPMDRKIVDKVCEDKARSARVYASPVDLDGYTFWNEWKFENRDKAYCDCWYWQLGYWVMEDVVATIREMNKDAQSILDAPVKRLMNAEFTMKQRRLPPGRARRGARRDRDQQGPRYVTNAKEGMTTPCTGRFTNETMDVIHFDVRVILRAGDVMPFMQELCRAKTHKFRGWYADQPEQTYKHNQITILESNIMPVDREGYEHDVYRYGDDAVIEVDLICEYIFDLAAYADVIPEQVEQSLLVEETTP